MNKSFNYEDFGNSLTKDEKDRFLQKKVMLNTYIQSGV